MFYLRKFFIVLLASNYYILVLARIITAIISGTILSISMTFASEIATVQYQPKSSVGFLQVLV